MENFENNFYFHLWSHCMISSSGKMLRDSFQILWHYPILQVTKSVPLRILYIKSLEYHFGGGTKVFPELHRFCKTLKVHILLSCLLFVIAS